MNILEKLVNVPSHIWLSIAIGIFLISGLGGMILQHNIELPLFTGLTFSLIAIYKRIGEKE